MKRNYKYIPIVAAMLAMMSCSQEEELTPQNGKDTPITIASVSVGDLTATRADEIDETNYLKGSSDNPVTMRTFVQGTDDKYSSVAGGEVWTHNGWQWMLNSTTETGRVIYFENNPQNQTITAFSPAADSYDGPQLIDGKITYTLGNVPDVLFAAPKGLDKAEVTIEMFHLMSHLTVNADIGTEISTGLQSLTITGLPSEVIFEPLNDEGKYLQYGSNVTYNSEKELIWEDQPEDSPYDIIYKSILIPHTSSSPLDFNLRVKIEDEEGNYRYLQATIQPQVVENGETTYGFKSGYNYTVNIKVGKDNIIVDSTAENPWGNGWNTEVELNNEEDGQ